MARVIELFELLLKKKNRNSIAPYLIASRATCLRTISFFACPRDPTERCFLFAKVRCKRRYKLINLSRNDARCYLHFLRAPFSSMSTICKDQQPANTPLFKRPCFSKPSSLFLLSIRKFKMRPPHSEYPVNCSTHGRVSNLRSRGFHGIFIF